MPVKLCCAKFGFTYSSLTLQGENVLRVADGSAQSDSAFIAAHTKVIENTIDNYKDNTSGRTAAITRIPIPHRQSRWTMIPSKYQR